MIADLMSTHPDRGHHIGMTQGAVADEKESGFRVIALQEVEHLRRESRVRAVIERKCHDWKPRAHAIHDVRCEPLQAGQQPQRFGPKHKEREQCDGADNWEQG